MELFRGENRDFADNHSSLFSDLSLSSLFNTVCSFLSLASDYSFFCPEFTEPLPLFFHASPNFLPYLLYLLRRVLFRQD